MGPIEENKLLFYSASGITHKYLTSLEKKSATERQSGLFCPTVNDEVRIYFTLRPIKGLSLLKREEGRCASAEKKNNIIEINKKI